MYFFNHLAPFNYRRIHVFFQYTINHNCILFILIYFVIFALCITFLPHFLGIMPFIPKNFLYHISFGDKWTKNFLFKQNDHLSPNNLLINITYGILLKIIKNIMYSVCVKYIHA